MPLLVPLIAVCFQVIYITLKLFELNECVVKIQSRIEKCYFLWFSLNLNASFFNFFQTIFFLFQSNRTEIDSDVDCINNLCCVTLTAIKTYCARVLSRARCERKFADIYPTIRYHTVGCFLLLLVLLPLLTSLPLSPVTSAPYCEPISRSIAMCNVCTQYVKYSLFILIWRFIHHSSINYVNNHILSSSPLLSFANLTNLCTMRTFYGLRAYTHAHTPPVKC